MTRVLDLEADRTLREVLRTISIDQSSVI